MRIPDLRLPFSAAVLLCASMLACSGSGGGTPLDPPPRAERIYSPPEAGGAVLHPLFSEDGTKVLFADHSPLYLNPWNGWRLHIADFDPNAVGAARLKNHRFLAPNGEGCYEGHEFRKDGRIVYTFTAGGKAYMDDIYAMNAVGTRKRLVFQVASFDAGSLPEIWILTLP